jgi:hypothetical protein
MTVGRLRQRSVPLSRHLSIQFLIHNPVHKNHGLTRLAWSRRSPRVCKSLKNLRAQDGHGRGQHSRWTNRLSDKWRPPRTGLWCVVPRVSEKLSGSPITSTFFRLLNRMTSLTERTDRVNCCWKRKGDCMSRFQQGSLFKLERKSVPDVWVFRWYENTSGKRIYKKQIIGRVTELRNRREAEKTVIPLRCSINAEVGTPKSVCDLAAHYRLHE